MSVKVQYINKVLIYCSIKTEPEDMKRTVLDMVISGKKIPKESPEQTDTIRRDM